MQDPAACDFSGATAAKPYEVFATFSADNKKYLAWLLTEGTGYILKFVHSNSEYKVDKQFKVTSVTGGGYKVGSQLAVVHARTLQF